MVGYSKIRVKMEGIYSSWYANPDNSPHRVCMALRHEEGLPAIFHKCLP